MSRLSHFPFGLLLAWMLASCGTPAAVQPTATTTPVPPTATMPQATATHQQVAEETATDLPVIASADVYYQYIHNGKRP